jgi:undecaprenyl diphosphate synthase
VSVPPNPPLPDPPNPPLPDPTDPLLPRASSDAPVHVACIMDGNGRWAKRRHMPRTVGHTEGEENLARLVRIAVTRNVGWLTVFGFSTENWVRPRGEVRHILGLHRKLFGRVEELNELNVRVQWMGRPFDSPEARTPRYVQTAIRKAIADTRHNTGMVLTVAFDYGSRAEILHAARAAAADGPIDEASMWAHMYLPDLPPVDVVVRTSGEERISNFMLWQSAGARVFFTDRAWPDFAGDDLDAAMSLVRS